MLFDGLLLFTHAYRDVIYVFGSESISLHELFSVVLQLAITERVVSSVERWATLQRNALMMEWIKRKALLRSPSTQSRTLVGNEEIPTNGKRTAWLYVICLNDLESI